MRFKLWSGVGVCVLGLALVGVASIMGIRGQAHAAGDDVACSGSAQPLAGAGDQAPTCEAASRVWDNFRATYSQNNFACIRAKFNWSFSITSPSVTTLTNSMSLIRQGEKYIYSMRAFNGEETIDLLSSWDGNMCVHHGKPIDLGTDDHPDDQHYAYSIDDQENQMHTVSVYEIDKFLGFLNSEGTFARAEPLSWDETNRVLTIGSDSVPIARIFFQDIKNCEYSKIEFLVNTGEGEIVGTKEASEWDTFGGLRLPRHVCKKDCTGKIFGEFHLEEFENNPTIETDFIAAIPYVDNQYIIDKRNKAVLEATQLDETLFQAKDYLQAFEKVNSTKTLTHASESESTPPIQGSDPDATLKVGDTAPKLEVAEWVKGDEIKFEAGNVYVVEFWATWCAPCRIGIPHLTELQEEYKDRKVTIISITMEDPGTVKPFVEKQGDEMVYTVAVDAEGKTFKAYMDAVGARGIPHAFVIDKEGKLAWHGHPMDEAFEQQLDTHAPPIPQDS